MSSSGHFGCTHRFLVIESGCPRLNGNFQGDFLARSKWQNDHSKLILIQINSLYLRPPASTIKECVLHHVDIRDVAEAVLFAIWIFQGLVELP